MSLLNLTIQNVRDALQQAGYITTTYTVATLPTGAKRAIVSDATVTTFASIVAGGGANKVPVYYDGTNWRIG